MDDDRRGRVMELRDNEDEEPLYPLRPAASDGTINRAAAGMSEEALNRALLELEKEESFTEQDLDLSQQPYTETDEGGQSSDKTSKVVRPGSRSREQVRERSPKRQADGSGSPPRTLPDIYITSSTSKNSTPTQNESISFFETPAMNKLPQSTPFVTTQRGEVDLDGTYQGSTGRSSSPERPSSRGMRVPRQEFRSSSDGLDTSTQYSDLPKRKGQVSDSDGLDSSTLYKDLSQHSFDPSSDNTKTNTDQHDTSVISQYNDLPISSTHLDLGDDSQNSRLKYDEGLGDTITHDIDAFYADHGEQEDDDLDTSEDSVARRVKDLLRRCAEDQDDRDFNRSTDTLIAGSSEGTGSPKRRSYSPHSRSSYSPLHPRGDAHDSELPPDSTSDGLYRSSRDPSYENDNLTLKVRELLAETSHLSSDLASPQPSPRTLGELVRSTNTTINYDRLDRELKDIHDSISDIPEYPQIRQTEFSPESIQSCVTNASEPEYGRSGTRRLDWDYAADIAYEDGPQFVNSVKNPDEQMSYRDRRSRELRERRPLELPSHFPTTREYETGNYTTSLSERMNNLLARDSPQSQAYEILREAEEHELELRMRVLRARKGQGHSFNRSSSEGNAPVSELMDKSGNKRTTGSPKKSPSTTKRSPRNTYVNPPCASKSRTPPKRPETSPGRSTKSPRNASPAKSPRNASASPSKSPRNISPSKQQSNSRVSPLRDASTYKSRHMRSKLSPKETSPLKSQSKSRISPRDSHTSVLQSQSISGYSLRDSSSSIRMSDDERKKALGFTPLSTKPFSAFNAAENYISNQLERINQRQFDMSTLSPRSKFDTGASNIPEHVSRAVPGSPDKTTNASMEVARLLENRNGNELPPDPLAQTIRPSNRPAIRDINETTLTDVTALEASKSSVNKLLTSDLSPSFTRPSTNDERILRPVRPGANSDVYFTESGADGETTMESIHTGSDDARPPFIPSHLLGSRVDNPSSKGIYGNRRKRAKSLERLDEETARDIRGSRQSLYSESKSRSQTNLLKTASASELYNMRSHSRTSLERPRSRERATSPSGSRRRSASPPDHRGRSVSPNSMINSSGGLAYDMPMQLSTSRDRLHEAKVKHLTEILQNETDSFGHDNIDDMWTKYQSSKSRKEITPGMSNHLAQLFRNPDSNPVRISTSNQKYYDATYEEGTTNTETGTELDTPRSNDTDYAVRNNYTTILNGDTTVDTLDVTTSTMFKELPVHSSAMRSDPLLEKLQEKIRKQKTKYEKEKLREQKRLARILELESILAAKRRGIDASASTTDTVTETNTSFTETTLTELNTTRNFELTDDGDEDYHKQGCISSTTCTESVSRTSNSDTSSTCPCQEHSRLRQAPKEAWVKEKKKSKDVKKPFYMEIEKPGQKRKHSEKKSESRRHDGGKENESKGSRVYKLRGTTPPRVKKPQTYPRTKSSDGRSKSKRDGSENHHSSDRKQKLKQSTKSSQTTPNEFPMAKSISNEQKKKIRDSQPGAETGPGGISWTINLNTGGDKREPLREKGNVPRFVLPYPPPEEPLSDVEFVLKRHEHEEKPQRLSLQEACIIFKPDFVSHSRERMKRLMYAAEERHIETMYKKQREDLFGEQIPLTRSHPMSDQWFNPKKRVITKREMKEQTNKIYKRLPEVVQKAEDLRKTERQRLLRIKAEIFKRRQQEKLLGRFREF